MLAGAIVYGETTRRYDLLAWAIMPDHVHLILVPIRPLAETMRWLKTATANRANTILGCKGVSFWRREYYDRWMRTERELSETITYVEENSVRRGLVGTSTDWRWSSAYTGGKTAGVTG
jgi:putative transposase